MKREIIVMMASACVMLAGISFAFHARNVFIEETDAFHLPNKADIPRDVEKKSPPRAQPIKSPAPTPPAGSKPEPFRATNAALKALNAKPSPQIVLEEASSNPDFKAKYLSAYELGIPRYFRAFLLNRGATEDQVQEFTRIQMEWREKWLEIHSQSATGNPNGLTPEAADKQNNATRDEALKALLGDDTPNAIKAYRNTATQRTIAASMAEPAFTMGEPVSHIQTEQLVQLITESHIEIRGGGEIVTIPSANEYENFYNRASAFLSPNQISLLKEVMNQQVALAEINNSRR